MLMDEIEYLPDGEMIPLNNSRPKKYYENKIYMIILILNCISGILKILGGISSLMFRIVIIEIKTICKDNLNLVLQEKEEQLLLKSQNDNIIQTSINESKSSNPSQIISINENGIKKVDDISPQNEESANDKFYTPRSEVVIK